MRLGRNPGRSVRVVATAIGTIALAWTLLFCSGEVPRSPDVVAASSWETVKGAPAIGAWAKGAMKSPARDEGEVFTFAARSRDAIAVRIPKHADRVFDLRGPRAEAPVHVTRIGASHAVAREMEGALVFADAWPGIDVAQFRHGDALEEALVVHDVAAQAEYALDVPARWRVVAVRPGVVDVIDDVGRLATRVRAGIAWDADGKRIGARLEVDGARVRVEWDRAARAPLVIDPTWEPAGAMTDARESHTATLLGDGTVLVVGGDDGTKAWASAEIYDPTTRTFATTGSLAESRTDHTATALPDGRVMIAGGHDGSAVRGSIEMYDPRGKTFSAGGALSVARWGHTATRLGDGRILFLGGNGSDGQATDVAEVFDPKTGGMTTLGARMVHPRMHHTATRLLDGRIVVVGGEGSGEIEVFDPGAGGFVVVGKLAHPRAGHVALLDPDTNTLTAIGSTWPENSDTLVPTEQIDLTSFSTQVGDPHDSPHMRFGASIGFQNFAILLAGDRGLTYSLDSGAYVAPVPDANVLRYKYGSLLWPPTIGHSVLDQPRARLTASALTDGSIVAIGGAESSGNSPIVLATAERFNFDQNAAGYVAGTMVKPRALHTSSMLPNGTVLLIGGSEDTSLEVFDSATQSFSRLLVDGLVPRIGHASTTLPGGSILSVGGALASGPPAEVLDPTSLSIAAVDGPALLAPCTDHTSTLLADGTVFVAGGTCGGGTMAWIIDPAQHAVVSTLPLRSSRAAHAAARLPNGKVLLVGGISVENGEFGSTPNLTAELYDPILRTISAAPGTLGRMRLHPSAVVLDDNDVLIAGGAGSTVSYEPGLASVEIYSLGSGAQAGFHFAGEMNSGRLRHTATRLADGRIAYIGGNNDGAIEVLDTSTLQFSQILDQNGTALKIQGTGNSHAATLLTNGDILLTGGQDITPMNSAEYVSIHNSPQNAYTSALTNGAESISPHAAIVLAGVNLASNLDSSSGSTSGTYGGGATFVWVPLDGALPVVGTTAAWDATRAAWFAPSSPFPGPGLVFPVVDGIRGRATFLTIGRVQQGLSCHYGPECQSGFCVDGVCCDLACVGACVACAAQRKGSGTDGTCGFVSVGARDDRCPQDPPCGGTGTCDDRGRCATVADGTTCGPNGETCSQSQCVASFHCEGNVEISPNGQRNDCGEYRCDGNFGRCQRICGSNADCAEGIECRSGRCEAFVPSGPELAGCCASRRKPDRPWVWWLAIGALMLARHLRARDPATSRAQASVRRA